MLAGMSADYYGRIEQQRGPLPSEPILRALARALTLTQSEQDHLFTLAGYAPAGRLPPDNRVSPAMRRIVERLGDTPATVLSRFGEALMQNDAAVALLGADYTRFEGLSRYLVYRWFTDPAQRAIFPPEDHEVRGRVFTAELRAAHSADPTGTAAGIVEALLERSSEFARVWRRHEVGVVHHLELKQYVHPVLGRLELRASRLIDPDEGQELLVYLAEPGSESEAKLERLRHAATGRPA